MIPDGIHRESSIKDKLKYSICCFSGTLTHEALEHGEFFYNKLNIPRTPTTPNSSSSWFKKSSTNNEFGGDPPKVRGRSLKSRMGRRYHRASQSADFSYDPSSYALNFENESPQEFPVRNFSARLPISPPTPSSPTKFSQEITVPPICPKKLLG
ncbi:hypothetical protein Lal_00012680 [Lupinus albus]|uniref:Uncharacterized protein n=1 Tax=Lupinus albus TaxID=3870 RepID=A0A6A5NKP2_LUPAL|nr:hypothetical protein Lalb_Chr22g0361461 [Lupinus albus]KAF1883763.1 hypothetical protein Lal_00012680 [Lupinus albus]